MLLRAWEVSSLPPGGLLLHPPIRFCERPVSRSLHKGTKQTDRWAHRVVAIARRTRDAEQPLKASRSTPNRQRRAKGARPRTGGQLHAGSDNRRDHGGQLATSKLVHGNRRFGGLAAATGWRDSPFLRPQSRPSGVLPRRAGAASLYGHVYDRKRDPAHLTGGRCR